MNNIRSFLNTDVDAICEVWNEHHADLGLQCQLDPLRLELFCLAKPYFEPGHFLISEDLSGKICGFLHYGSTANSDLTDVSETNVAIYALCVRPGQNEDRVARGLLRHMEALATSEGALTCSFRPTLPNCGFFLSMGPADSMAGAITQEVRLCKWLSQAGFSPCHPTCLWELELASFQAPIDRLQIQIRRSATVNQQLDEPHAAWWTACVLGHTEPTEFLLMHRTEKRVKCDALFWSLSPELQTTADQIVWLWPPPNQEGAQQQDELVFLLAEALRQYQQERFEIIRAACYANDTLLTTLFRRLGFRAAQNGMVFQKKFA